MKNNIASGYLKFFRAFALTILLAVCCFLFGFIIVWPLWKWASASPSTYTWAILALIALFIIYRIVRACISKGVKTVLIHAVRIICPLAGLALTFILILENHKLAALFVFLAFTALTGFLITGLHEKNVEQ